MSEINELKVAGRRILTSSDQPRMTVEPMPVEDDPGTMQYTATVPIALERAAINSIMRMPLGMEGDRWMDVRNGLYDMAYPSRRVRRMARSAFMRQHLGSVRFSAWQLGDTLDLNQDYRTKSANVPVFNYGQAQSFSYDMLKKTHPHRLINMMKSVGVDPKLARAFFGKDIQSSLDIAELEALTGIDDSGDDPEHILADAMVDATAAKYIVELMHRVQEDEFAGFKRKATADAEGLHFGGDDLISYIRRSDVPAGFIGDEAESADDELLAGVTFLDTTIDVGPVLPDKDRSTDRERHKVTFSKHAHRWVAMPRLTWHTKPDGERKLIFYNSNHVEGTPDVARANSLVGAAILASIIGKEIDYDKEIKRVSHTWRAEPPRSHAGLWPLVAYYRQDELFDDPYFEKIEDAVK